jgi:hypothetical protein
MTISIDRINSAAIRDEMHRDNYTTAEFFGTFGHPQHPDSRDWDVTLYRAAGQLVFETNADPVWEICRGFDELAAEYGINVAEVAS